jgi:hypothetical protein
MSFRSYEDVAADVIAELVATGEFKSVTCAAVSSPRQLLEHAANIVRTPKAIVVIGDGGYEQYGAVRRFSVGIAVLAEFRAGTADVAKSVWALVDAAVAPFLPVFASGQAPAAKIIEGVRYEPKNWTPIETSDRSASFVIEIEALDVFTDDTEQEQPVQ